MARWTAEVYEGTMLTATKDFPSKAAAKKWVATNGRFVGPGRTWRTFFVGRRVADGSLSDMERGAWNSRRKGISWTGANFWLRFTY